MRITGEAVREISQWAAALSNGYVGEVQLGQDLGNGSRIMDANSQVVWLGKPREAAGYYLGQVDAFASERGIILAQYPARVAEVRAEILPGNTEPTDPKVARWYTLGRQDAMSRTEHYCPEIRGAGLPKAA